MTPKLCECGCGQPAPIASKTQKSQGAIAGQPQRFITGHNMRNLPRRTGYPQMLYNGKVVQHHRRRAEIVLGKPLPRGAQVHHPDDDPMNRASRLVICENSHYHHFLHARTKTVRAGGNPNTHKLCWFCQTVKPFADFHRVPSRVDGLSVRCCQCPPDTRDRREIEARV